MNEPCLMYRKWVSKEEMLETYHMRKPMNEFTLLGNRILVQIQEEGPKTVNGIIMPSTTPERFPTATVAVVSLDVPLVNEGDEILVDRHSGMKITINGEQYQLIKSEDVIAVFGEKL